MSTHEDTTDAKHKDASGDEQVEVRPEAIPEELKRRDQWLLWDAASDRKQPHWNGDVTISWSDPRDWHSFEEAVEVAQERESWGIGYVCAVENSDYDDGEYGVIDVDGVLGEGGDFADWLPGLERFEDSMTYMEYSPSGTGAHIPFRGQPPEWWRDGQVGEHEGIDVLANKFCTFTGDTMNASGNTVADIDVAPWLLEAFREIHGEYPSTVTAAGDEDGEEWLTDELVEEALGHLDPDCSYPTWRDVAFAVHDYDCTQTGKALFKDWSSSGSKFDGKAREQIERIWDDAVQGSGITVATLVHRAKEGGWSPDTNQTDGGLSADIEVQDGCYGKWVSSPQGETYWDQITTFTMEVNSYLADPQREANVIDATVVPASGFEQPYDVKVETTVFNDINEFKSEICTRNTTVFEGSYDDLNALRMELGQTEAPTLQGTRKVGIHEDELVTPNETVDEEWGSIDVEHKYIDTGAPLDGKWALDSEDGGYDEEEVAEFLELLPQTRDTERYLPIIGWWYAIGLTNWIREWEGELSMATVVGDAGTGKTAAIGILAKAIGLDGEPFSSDQTKFSLVKQLSASTNIPIWYDEYKPSDIEQQKLNDLQSTLRLATRGATETRGRPDQTTTTYRLESPAIISGEQAIQGPAEERRSIQTQFKKSVTQDGTDTARAFSELVGDSYRDEDGNVVYADPVDPSEHAKAYWQYVLGLDKEEAHQVWEKSLDYVRECLEEWGIEGVGGLEQQSLQTIKFGLTLYRQFANRMGADVEVILTDDAIDEALKYVAESMGETNRTTHVGEFLEMVDAVMNDGELEPGKDFRFVNANKPNAELRLKLDRVHHKVSKYLRDHALDGYDFLNKSTDYKARMRDMAEQQNTYIAGTSVNTSGLNRCVSIKIEEAKEQLDGFNIDPTVDYRH